MCTHHITRLLCPLCRLTPTLTLTSETKCPSAAAAAAHDDPSHKTFTPKEHCLKWSNKEVKSIGKEPCWGCKVQEEKKALGGRPMVEAEEEEEEEMNDNENDLEPSHIQKGRAERVLEDMKRRRLREGLGPEGPKGG
ncbi:hypothetical protein B0H65DRAFT_574175 [Neurospora tetraspora]|uniref:Stc1 domain-containing protein n=1 Tax=Neurospora tetraspora TaxID=94610 RepID=A0AAE0JFU8_9PEZI|nr:hypothetical protein B0H65DRAFT_574175 [Neurospora tetraspora]